MTADAPTSQSSPTSPTSPTPDAPALRVVSGDPTPEEVAALVAVLSAVGGGDDAEPPRRRSPWSDPGRRLGGSFERPAGRDGWRTSGLPR